MTWRLAHRADRRSRLIADRHYNRQKVGAPQFVPPGRCLVLRDDSCPALWVTSWPFPQYVQHNWPGAWINSLFRKEGGGVASAQILAAIAATRAIWSPPAIGMVSFVDPTKVPGISVRGERIFGYSYLKAGFQHVGETKGGLWAWQLLPENMPAPALALEMQMGFAA